MTGEVGEADRRVDPAVFVENRRAEGAEAEAAAALPADILRDAALLAFDDLLHPQGAVGAGMLAHFDADPPASHLVRDGSRGARAEEAVEDEVAGVGGDVENALDQALGFWRAKARRLTESILQSRSWPSALCPAVIMWPKSREELVPAVTSVRNAFEHGMFDQSSPTRSDYPHQALRKALLDIRQYRSREVGQKFFATWSSKRVGAIAVEVPCRMVVGFPRAPRIVIRILVYCVILLCSAGHTLLGLQTSEFFA